VAFKFIYDAGGYNPYDENDVIQNLTIINAHQGIIIDYGSPVIKDNTIENCIISSSSENTHGAGISCRSSATIENNTILNHPYTYEDDLFQYYIDKSILKKIQLDNTAKKYKCNKRIMVLVLNDQNIFGFLTPDECTKILSKISTELDWGSNYYFAIITGWVSLDIIYPSIML